MADGAPYPLPKSAQDSAPLTKRATAAWVLFDLANTIFLTSIVALYFPLWVVDDMGGSDGDYGIANSVSMAFVLVFSPWLGALSDRASRRMPFLIAATVACCVFTAGLGLGGLSLSLACFVLANFAFQAGVIFYDALLPVVSTEATRGRVSGIGIGVGYAGSLVAIGLGSIVLHFDEAAKPLVFKLTALLFLAFALPCFVWVREGRRPAASVTWSMARRAGEDVRRMATHLRHYRDLRRFLMSRVFYADAANTLLVFLGIYATQEIGFTEAQVQLALAIGLAAAITGGIGWGWVVDRIGPKPALMRVLALWSAVLALVVAVAYLDLSRSVFWVVAPLAGIALSGTWAADRMLMLRLSPPPSPRPVLRGLCHGGPVRGASRSAPVDGHCRLARLGPPSRRREPARDGGPGRLSAARRRRRSLG